MPGQVTQAAAARTEAARRGVLWEVPLAACACAVRGACRGRGLGSRGGCAAGERWRVFALNSGLGFGGAPWVSGKMEIREPEWGWD